MAAFVLVPGGWYGGWVYDPVVQALTGQGHLARGVTLSNSDGRSGKLGNLSQHIHDVIDVVAQCEEPVVLCGHSYGGMVITGIADAVPDRIASLVHLDAYVPADGDSTWSLTSPHFRDLFIAGTGLDGLMCAPPAGIDPRCPPYPISAFIQQASLTGAWQTIARKTYVAAQGWEGSPFTQLFGRLQADADWTTLVVDCGHNIPRHAPEKTAEILLQSI